MITCTRNKTKKTTCTQKDYLDHILGMGDTSWIRYPTWICYSYQFKMFLNGVMELMKCRRGFALNYKERQLQRIADIKRLRTLGWIIVELVSKNVTDFLLFALKSPIQFPSYFFFRSNCQQLMNRHWFATIAHFFTRLRPALKAWNEEQHQATCSDHRSRQVKSGVVRSKLVLQATCCIFS